MKVLGFDTSLKYLTVALRGDGNFFETVMVTAIKHAENLLPVVDSALNHLKIGIKEIELLVVGIGPGSFTGIRVGLATAKGFMVSLGIPAVGIPTTELLAANMPKRSAAVCIPARKGHAYLAVYDQGRCVLEPEFVRLETVGKLLREGKFNSYPLVGEGWEKITKRNLPCFFNRPNGFRLLELGVEKFRNGEYAKGPKELTPLYVERPIAEIKFASS
ncbi:MAG: tRNA (adenosine(37)-N6)-threonylcarbamoyltransferase complex dimerization subunit type 1 TsaB [Thermotogae bacterium]|nr:MAG: tRNA (adenosine(37)-N6)-threonylcarbamoyltransferase complex dimerization subunit type 1 TsaB [Thermotogota bacterium]